MSFYALGIKPLIDALSQATQEKLCKQSWYADDSNAAGRLREVKKWWDTLIVLGPKYGYYPKPSKTVLIVKDPSMEQLAKDLFCWDWDTNHTPGSKTSWCLHW